MASRIKNLLPLISREKNFPEEVEQTDNRKYLTTPIIVVTGFISATLGIIAILGWYLRLPSLIQIHPTFAPMQFNTALCFVASGGALALAALRRFRIASVLASGVLFLALLTIFQYVSHRNLGIDELFFKHYIFTATSHPGRMSPITAVVFSLFGLGLLPSSLRPTNLKCAFFCGIIASIVVSLATVAVFGYLTGLTGTYGWNQLSQMAVNTSIGALFIGIGLMAFAWRIESSATRRSPSWFSLAAGFALVFATFSLSSALRARNDADVRRIVKTNGEAARNEIIARLESRTQALRRMAQRWIFSGKPIREAWEDDAKAYVEDFPGYQGIGWVDSETRVQWVIPLEENSVVIGKRLDAEPKRAAAFEEVRQKNEARFSRPLQLSTGGMGILLPIPMTYDNRFQGFIVGAISLKPLLEFMLSPRIAEGYAIYLTEGDQELYRRQSDFPLHPTNKFDASVPVSTQGIDWTVTVRPEARTVEALKSPYPLAVLIFGTLFSGLLTLSIHFARNAFTRSQEVDETNAELRNVIIEREKIQNDLEELGMLQHAILTHAAYSVISTTPEGLITSFNPAAERMLGYRAQDVVGKQTPAILHKPSEVIARAASLSKELGKEIEPGFEVFVAKSRESDLEQREWTYIRRDGSPLPVTLGVTALRNHEGSITGFLGIASDISDLKRAVSELERTHAKLLDVSHRAGMAEVATSVLHNVGNVLNSVNISSSVVADQVRKSRILAVGRIATLLREHEHDLSGFLTKNPTGVKLPQFIASLSEQLLAEQRVVLDELELLGSNIDHIKDIVAMQQSYATVRGAEESLNIGMLIEDSLRMNQGSLSRHEIEIVKDYEDTPDVLIQKHKAIQILVNLISNAKHACDHSEIDPKVVSIRVTTDETMVYITVSDNGIGIPGENLTRIFAHGFTTKKDGHGFGLHSASLAAAEMGGSLSAKSDGKKKGASFTLALPLHPVTTTATSS